MRKLLHKNLRLKEGLDFGGLDLDTEDLVEALPDDHYDPYDRASKRQRVETIATQYLKGQAPIILSAGLRGPFSGKWNNPWRQESEGDARLISRNAKRVMDTQDLSGEASGTRRGTRHQRKAKLPTISHTHEENPVKDARGDIPLVQESKAGNIRKIGQTAKEVVGKDSDHGERTTIPVTGVATDISVQPSAAEFFSANNKRRTSQTNVLKSQWLRRRPKGRGAGLGNTDELERSPSPSRRRTRPFEGKSDGELHIHPRGVPANTRSSPGLHNAQMLDDSWRSSGLSGISPNTKANPLEKQVEHGEKSYTTINIIQEQDTPFLVEPNEQTEDSYTSVLNLYEASPLIVEGLRSAKRLAQTAIQEAVSPEGHRHLPPSRKAIRRSAQQCATGVNSANSPTLKPKRNRASGSRSKQARLGNSRTDDAGLVPAPASSTSFTYRKLGNGRTATTRTTGKLKPRPVKFKSSSAAKDRTGASIAPTKEDSEYTTEEHSSVGQGSGCGRQFRRSDIYDVPTSDHDSTEDERSGEQQECERSNRQSLFSTQAAMMLAQMEFQEESIPPPASETPRPLAHFQEDASTIAGGYEGPSSAITPISDFTAQLDERDPSPDSILRPMSTQELFAATSPYAFSSKKSAIPRRSNLRFAVLSNQEPTMGIGSENGKNSPTLSAERIPLKDRNSHVAFRGINGSVKGSQEPLGHPRVRSEKKVELPRVSLDASLGGGLGFTDEFLSGMNVDSVGIQ